VSNSISNGNGKPILYPVLLYQLSPPSGDSQRFVSVEMCGPPSQKAEIRLFILISQRAQGVLCGQYEL
jgi:hypothetical protein